VGAGEGLVGFCALARFPHKGVVSPDISQGLVERCAQLATGLGAPDMCGSTAGDAIHLPFREAVFDTVTTRSVLIYIRDKRRVFREFYRVLKPGELVSVFEPINRLSQDERGFRGYDSSGVSNLARRMPER